MFVWEAQCRLCQRIAHYDNMRRASVKLDGKTESPIWECRYEAPCKERQLELTAKLSATYSGGPLDRKTVKIVNKSRDAFRTRTGAVLSQQDADWIKRKIEYSTGDHCLYELYLNPKTKQYEYNYRSNR